VDKDYKELAGLGERLMEMRWTLDDCLSEEKVAVLAGEVEKAGGGGGEGEEGEFGKFNLQRKMLFQNKMR